MDGSQVDILIDIDCTSALMPKAYYDKHTILHSLPKYDTLVKNIVVGSGQLLPVYFAIPVPLRMGEHTFQCFTLVADVSNQCDFVIGLKEMFELEVLLDTQEQVLKYINRSALVLPWEDIEIPPGKSTQVTFEVIFPEELSGYATYKWTFGAANIFLSKVRVLRNHFQYTIENLTSNETLKLKKYEACGVVDARCLGFFKIPYKRLEASLLGHYTFLEARQVQQTIQHIQQTNPHSFQRASTSQSPQDPYPWLAPDDERRTMSDTQILDTYVDLSQSKLNRSQKKKVRKLLHSYK